MGKQALTIYYNRDCLLFNVPITSLSATTTSRLSCSPERISVTHVTILALSRRNFPYIFIRQADSNLPTLYIRLSAPGRERMLSRIPASSNHSYHIFSRQKSDATA